MDLPTPISPEQLPPQPANNSGEVESTPVVVERKRRHERRIEAPLPGAEIEFNPEELRSDQDEISGMGAAAMAAADDTQQPTAVVNDSNSPLITDDVDVIEKEWVDRAKQIVAATKDDPHAQEEQFEKLQIDYMDKRYGKQIKSAE